MKLKFINAQETDKKAKCTIHTSGKLGFSTGAIELMKLSEEKSVGIAINEDDAADDNLYAIVYEEINPGAFKVGKAGQYFYINTKSFFDTSGIEYKKRKFIYDIVEFEFDGTKMFKLIKRELKKKEVK